MKEYEKLPIKKIIINDGTNEYNTEQIYFYKNIYGLAVSTISFKLLQPWNSHLIDKINSEGATLVIKTDSQHKKNEISLKNASPELTNEFYKVV
jgi:hypothetical protein|tara:strand:- start:215 stop:496 length:282 start_codon:yes stop_codon:yes gene_type:complete